MQVDTWDGQINYEDLAILFRELARKRVSVIGEPMEGTPYAFILTDNFAKSDDLLSKIESVISDHVNQFAPAPAS